MDKWQVFKRNYSKYLSKVQISRSGRKSYKTMYFMCYLVVRTEERYSGSEGVPERGRDLCEHKGCKRKLGRAEGKRQHRQLRTFNITQVQRVKKLQKRAEYNIQSSIDYRPTSYTATPINLPDYLKNYHEPLYNNYTTSYQA